MTLKEADEAACKCLPIRMEKPGHPAEEYSRITRTGCVYLEDGRRGGFVQLRGRGGPEVVLGRGKGGDRMPETVEGRALTIAAKIMVAAGLCRHNTPLKCKKFAVDDAVCDKCIREWLIDKAKNEPEEEVEK